MLKSKYKNKKCEYLGLKFDSIGEKNRYIFLKDAEKKGVIHDLKLQVPYKICVNDQLICKYIADFVYIKNGETIVDDFKGAETAVFRLKKKLMHAIHGIEIRIVKNPTEEI